MNPPRLLILRRLLEPSRRAQNALEEIKEKLPCTASESIELRGFFVLMVSAVETMLTDTYVYYLRSFPEAFDFKDARFSKDDILAANLALDLIEQQVEKNAISQAYESFPELLRTFTKTIGITAPPLDPDLIDRIVEAKENPLEYGVLCCNVSCAFLPIRQGSYSVDRLRGLIFWEF
jgi:hypothetical protein